MTGGREASRVQTEREGVILRYRLGRKAQYPRECLIKVPELEPAEAGGMVGRRVSWPADRPEIHGVIVGLHGRRGTLRARFNRGVPGQALGSRVRIRG